MADATYQPKVYRKQGGDEWVVASGGKITVESGGDIEASQIYDGSDVKNTADANVIGGIPVLHRIDLAAGALGNTDVVLTHKTRVVDAWLVLRGAGVATTTLQVKNGANAITDAMAASGSDQALVRAATIDDSQHEIAAGGTLRVTSATGGRFRRCSSAASDIRRPRRPSSTMSV